MEMFSLKKLNKVEGKEQYDIKISKGVTDMENIGDDDDINRAL
jgi:hypothetical protein